MAVNGVQASAQSIEAVNQVMQQAMQASVEQVEKLVKLNVEQAVGAEVGKGAQMDVTG